MEKCDITKNTYTVIELSAAIKSKIQNHTKPIQVTGRFGDAFVYVLSGSCTYKFLDGNEFTACKGDVLFLANHSVYTMLINTDEYHFIFCNFRFDTNDSLKSNIYSPSNTEKIKNNFQNLLICKRKPMPESFTKQMAIIYTIYSDICFETTKKQIKLPIKKKIQEIKQYIDTNSGDPNVTVAFLAKKANLSEFHFRKLFSNQYGMPPKQYISMARISHAKELMKYPFLTIDDCALQSGFSSHQYFCAVFKNATGITPSAYQKKIKNKD